TEATEWLILAEVAKAWGPKDSAAALQAAGSLDTSIVKDRFVWEVMESWASQVPTEAAAAVAGLPSLQQINAGGAVAKEWAAKDPAAAANWAELQPLGAYGSPALTSAVNAWMGQDQEAALNWIATIKDTSARNYALAVASSQIATEAPDLALTIANTISDAKNRQQALISIQDHLQQVDPQRARALSPLIYGTSSAAGH
ncbi:MAG TPA: hypothetical protein VHV47_02230, partial [Opitutaceae bacterium]|nr:hypothetical protein [Opitutaceae bacterium]